jgi:hypothetical protein
MTQLYRITPVNTGSIKMVLSIVESSTSNEMLGEDRGMSIITVYNTGCAFRRMDKPVYASEIDSYIECNAALGAPELTDPRPEEEFEFNEFIISSDGNTHIADVFQDMWTNGTSKEGYEGLTKMDLFTSDAFSTGRWSTASTKIRILGPVTIDIVTGTTYTNVIETNIQPLTDET